MGPWTTRPRFYPPGKHPATARWREHLKKAEEVFKTLYQRPEHKPEDTVELEKLVAYLKQQLADFEQAESELKMRAYEFHARRG